jgi:NADPH-dependent curcumin reductase CurA
MMPPQVNQAIANGRKCLRCRAALHRMPSFAKRYGLNNLHSIVGMDITLQSYRNSSYEQLLVEIQERLGGWLMEGSMKFKMHIAEGLENLPTAFGGIFSGENFGKFEIG